MLKINATILATLLLTACSAVAIQDTQPEDLAVSVDYRHRPNAVEVRAEIRTGVWDRRVNADAQRPEIITAGGEVIALKTGIKEGDYGVQLDPDTGPFLLVLPQVGEMNLPLTEPVTLDGQAPVSEQLFNQDDELTLSISGSTERPRGWSFTAYCGDEHWTLNLPLAQDETRIQLPFATLMRQINAKAKTDLAGLIPVTVTLWEDYEVDWAAPFQPGLARAEDSLNFQVDTASFRVQASFRLQLQNVSIGVNNQAWPVRYCH